MPWMMFSKECENKSLLENDRNPFVKKEETIRLAVHLKLFVLLMSARWATAAHGTTILMRLHWSGCLQRKRPVSCPARAAMRSAKAASVLLESERAAACALLDLMPWVFATVIRSSSKA